jgi:hypothetical protein
MVWYPIRKGQALQVAQTAHPADGDGELFGERWVSYLGITFLPQLVGQSHLKVAILVPQGSYVADSVEDEARQCVAEPIHEWGTFQLVAPEPARIAAAASREKAIFKIVATSTYGADRS